MRRQESEAATPETLRRFLHEEARRVALGMGLFRDEFVGRFHGDPSTQHACSRKGHVGDTRFSPFYYYPFLFASAFPSVAVEALRSLAQANRILLEAILLSDKRIDQSQRWTPEDLFLLDSCYQKALEILIPLFPLDHDFWPTTEKWFFQHARAIHKEQTRHRHRLSPYTPQEFFEIATGKVALIRTNLLAMSYLSGHSKVLSPLMESQDRFLAGFQCFDDLRDWKEDLHQRNFTFLLTRVLFEGSFEHPIHGAEVPSRGEIGQVLYHRGIAEDQLRMAERYFQSALDFARPAHVPVWMEMVSGFLSHCASMRHDLSAIRQRAGKADKSRPREPRPVKPPNSPRTQIVVHADLPGNLRNQALSTLTQLRRFLPRPWPHAIYVGHWPGMPPHFLLKTAGRFLVGANARIQREGTALSTGGRPLGVDIVMSVMTAHRCRVMGPLKDRLEHLYVAGLALRVCAEIWPHQTAWQQLGMRKLEWFWCRVHEAFLWGELKRFFLHPSPKSVLFHWLLPHRKPSASCPIPAGGSLYLGRSLFTGWFDHEDQVQRVSELLCMGRPDIVRTFRRKVGLESHENRLG